MTKQYFVHHFNTTERVNRSGEKILPDLRLSVDVDDTNLPFHRRHIQACSCGFHGSPSTLDALSYLPFRANSQSIYWNPRVLSGVVDIDFDKIAAEHCWWPYGEFECFNVIKDFVAEVVPYVNEHVIGRYDNITYSRALFDYLSTLPDTDTSSLAAQLEQRLFYLSGFDRSIVEGLL